MLKTRTSIYSYLDGWISKINYYSLATFKSYFPMSRQQRPNQKSQFYNELVEPLSEAPAWKEPVRALSY